MVDAGRVGAGAIDGAVRVDSAAMQSLVDLTVAVVIDVVAALVGAGIHGRVLGGAILVVAPTVTVQVSLAGGRHEEADAARRITEVFRAGIAVFAADDCARAGAGAADVIRRTGVQIVAGRVVVERQMLAVSRGRVADVQGARILIVAAARREPADAGAYEGVADVVGAGITVFAVPVVAAAVGEEHILGAAVGVIAVDDLVDAGACIHVAEIDGLRILIVAIGVEFAATLDMDAAQLGLAEVVRALVLVIAVEQGRWPAQAVDAALVQGAGVAVVTGDIVQEERRRTGALEAARLRAGVAVVAVRVGVTAACALVRLAVAVVVDVVAKLQGAWEDVGVLGGAVVAVDDAVPIRVATAGDRRVHAGAVERVTAVGRALVLVVTVDRFALAQAVRAGALEGAGVSVVTGIAAQGRAKAFAGVDVAAVCRAVVSVVTGLRLVPAQARHSCVRVARVHGAGVAVIAADVLAGAVGQQDVHGAAIGVVAVDELVGAGARVTGVDASRIIVVAILHQNAAGLLIHAADIWIAEVDGALLPVVAVEGQAAPADRHLAHLFDRTGVAVIARRTVREGKGLAEALHAVAGRTRVAVLAVPCALAGLSHRRAAGTTAAVHGSGVLFPRGRRLPRGEALGEGEWRLEQRGARLQGLVRRVGDTYAVIDGGGRLFAAKGQQEQAERQQGVQRHAYEGTGL